MNDFVIAGVSLANAMSKVKSDPSNPALRIGLFRMFSFTGQWSRALTQLQTASQLDPSLAIYASAYQACLACEGVREACFSGDKSPVFLGQPAQWQALLLQALHVVSAQARAELMMSALDAAPESGGTLDGQNFAWISDVDHRFGPQVEAFIDGKYYWIGFDRLEAIRFLERSDLIDHVWQPVEFLFHSGGSKNGYLPLRYPGSASSQNQEVVRGEFTEFTDLGDSLQTAVGARQWVDSENNVYRVVDCTELRLPGAEG